MDFGRILFGDFSTAIALEIVFRTVLMYLYTLLIIRFVGKRGLGQLSPFELVIIVALGSAVGDPMFYADVPVILGLIVITVVVVLQKILEELSEKWRRLEVVLESKPRRLVAAGVVDAEALDRENLTESELFTALREQGIEHMGQVRLAYLEPSGSVSVFEYDDGPLRPGRSILPEAID